MTIKTKRAFFGSFAGRSANFRLAAPMRALTAFGWKANHVNTVDIFSTHGERNMTKAQHTPGPWRRNGSLIESPQMALSVASVYPERVGWAPKSKDEYDANARLIAAAPELLAALVELVALQDRYNSAPMTELAKTSGKEIAAYWAAAIVAIAKARGE
jgi:hypothetical protein